MDKTKKNYLLGEINDNGFKQKESVLHQVIELNSPLLSNFDIFQDARYINESGNFFFAGKHSEDRKTIESSIMVNYT